jgi:hypothetical protein
MGGEPSTRGVLKVSNGIGSVDPHEFDVRVDGLLTDRVGPSERHEIEFNVYSLLRQEYAVAGRTVDDADLVNNAVSLKRDLQRLEDARATRYRYKRHGWWRRLLLGAR